MATADRKTMDRLLMFIATGAGSGYLPKAPGTWGTLVGLLLWWPLAGLSLTAYLAAVAALFLVGVASAGAAEKILDRGDPGVVVIDEIVGVLIALTAAPLHPAAALVGFALWLLA
jgi:phosphatidylglycerophosphatase A